MAAFQIAYGSGVVPLVMCVAQGADPFGNVLVNAQVEGTPTNTQCKIRVTKSNLTVVALLGLTILSIPASVGATTVTIYAKAP